MERDFTVKTEVFEGPLELLLNLIEKRKLLINDIALSQVTDDYIQYIKAHEAEFPIGKISHFIVVASTLLLIKSKSLLPTLELTEEETASVEDLELRLRIYQRIKTASETVRGRLGTDVLFSRQFVKQEQIPTFAPPTGISVAQILESIKNFTKSLPKVEKVPQAMIKKVISLEDMIGRLTQRIRTGLQMGFREFSGMGKEEKVTVIVSFLAMLELVKQGLIAVEQESDGDIRMLTKDVGTPNYM
jgi:segregation and condensation protein A